MILFCLGCYESVLDSVFEDDGLKVISHWIATASNISASSMSGPIADDQR